MHKILLFLLFFFPALGFAKTKKAEIQARPGILNAQGRWEINGRVMYRSRSLEEKPKTSRVRSMLGMFRRFTRNGVPYANLFLRLPHQTLKILADNRGRFQIGGVIEAPTTQPTTAQPTTQPTTNASCQRPRWSDLPLAQPTAGILPLRIELNPQQQGLQAPPQESFLVREAAPRGLHIISDVDDTLIWTNVTQKTKMAKDLLFKDTKEVRIIDGAPTFLHTALCSPNGQGGGTLHYLSGSPTRLFDRIASIFRLHRFPLGSLTLKPISGKQAYPLTEQLKYKLDALRRILAAFPQRPFLLLGDNGEKDPVIYDIIRKEYPQQIRAIFIHQVQPLTPEQKALKDIYYFSSYAEAEKKLPSLSEK